VWQGSDGVAAGEALATCGEGAVDAAYALDASSGEWLRWFRDRPEISKLSTVGNMQGFIALGSSTASPSPTVKLEPPEPGRMRGCPLPGKWAIAVWEGPDASEPDATLDTCGVWQADVAYSLDPLTGGWARWFRASQDLTTLYSLSSYMAAFVWGAGATSNPIAFESYRGDHTWEIYVMNSNGTNPTRLTNNLKSDHDPAWSPDGTKIAFKSGLYANGLYGQWEIYLMNANGSLPANLTNHPADDFDPAWSPDGTKIAFVSDRIHWTNDEIYVMNANGTGQTRLTNNAAWDHGPAWSPDGTKIAFESDRDGNWEIYVMNANGTVQGNATLNGADDLNPAWSPDGSKIAFDSNRGGNGDIYVMNADGTGQTRLTNHPADDSRPAWSPDGSKIVFDSYRDGNDEIYVMNADGTGQTNLTNNAGHDNDPAWSPVP
jgi:Tol biopolymer transport system component